MPIINLVYEAPSGGGGWQPGANTLAYYTFDEQNLDDTSGNNNNGTWYNNAGSFVATSDGYCASLGGLHAIQLPFTLAGLSEWTLNQYFKISNNKTYQGIIGTTTWTTGTMHTNYCYGTSQGDFIEVAIAGSASLKFGGGLATNTWYNIGITKNGTTYSVYQNGVLLDSQTSGNFTYTGTLYLGMTYNTDRCLDGYLDNVIIEDKARTVQEISDYYDQTKGNYGL